MRSLSLLLLTTALIAAPARASDDPVKDTRQILAGTVTSAASKAMYTRGLNDQTDKFKGALASYKAVRAAEKPPVVTPPPVVVPPVVNPPVVTPPGIVWTSCADEDAVCTLPGPGTVRFGANGKFFTRDFVLSTPCTFAVFGDPLPYVRKSCSYVLTGQPTPPPPVVVAPPVTTPPVVTPPVVLPPVVTDLFGPVGERAFNAAPGVAAIPSNFDLSLVTAKLGIPPSAKPDDVGAFRFMCGGGQLSYDDPIVYPGQKGKSHLHQYFGNLKADGNSTYESLRTTGGSTCEGYHDVAANRSAYWQSAMLDGHGNAVRPDRNTVYYKRRPISDPKCHLDSGDPRTEGDCVPLPNGLKFIFGYDMLTGKAQTGAVSFSCIGPTANSTGYATMKEAVAHCPITPTNGAYNSLTITIHAPTCWDGKNLDSPNHRDHVAYFVFDGSKGLYSCPATHPKMIPAFTLGTAYTVDANLADWHLSSDEAVPGALPGQTFHADWFGAWDNQVEAMWMDGCINKLLNCSGGDTGSGTIIKEAYAGIYGPNGTVLPRLVPLASIPQTSDMSSMNH